MRTRHVAAGLRLGGLALAALVGAGPPACQQAPSEAPAEDEGGTTGEATGGAGERTGGRGDPSGGTSGSHGDGGTYGTASGGTGATASGGSPGGSPDAAASSDSGPAGDPNGSPEGSPASASEACGKGIAPPAEGIHELDVAGLKRRFFLRVPDAYDGKKAWPVVFGFHGAGNKDAAWFDTNTGFRAENEDKAVMLFPESLTAGGSHTWMTLSQHPANLAFVDALADWTKKNLCVDPTRFFATGQSSGGYFSQTMGCQRGDLFRAVASNSGGERYFENCKGTPGVLVSYGKGDDATHVGDATKAVKFWIERKGCKAEGPTSIDPAPCVQYTGCMEGAPLVVCAHPGGHPWPPYANKGFWKFFAQF